MEEFMSSTTNWKNADLVGQTFNRLKVLSLAQRKGANGQRYWNCICDCGAIRVVNTGNLRSGEVKSCGCLRNEGIDKALRKHGHRKKTANKLLVDVYYAMHQRCYTPETEYYYRYGGRGIYICDEWLSESGLTTFMNWALPLWEKGLQIDRYPDNNGPYAPWNCRFVPPIINAYNKNTTIKIPHNGELISLFDYYQLGLTTLPFKTLKHRVYTGWDWEDAKTVPYGGRRKK